MEYERALSESPWIIGDNYLHVQRWRHNFLVDSAKITSLPVWVRFPWLPVEYYTEEWLWKAGNTIGKTIKIDDTTLAASRGKFALACVEIDLEKPLVAVIRYEEGKGYSNMKGSKNCVLHAVNMVIGRRSSHCRG